FALKPVIEGPSKPMPSSSAPSISDGVIAKLFRCPSMSVNQRRMNSIPSSLIRPRTALLSSGSLVARDLDSTCAIADSSFKRKTPQASTRLRPRRPESRGAYQRLGPRDLRQLLELRLAAAVADRAPVEAERGEENRRPRGER